MCNHLMSSATCITASYHWEHGSDEALHYKANVSDLHTGTTYQIRVVAKNGEGYEAPSEWQEFITGGIGRFTTLSTKVQHQIQ